MYLKLVFWLSIFSQFLQHYSDAAKILAIFPTASKSHWILGQQLMHTLADSGHEMTVISQFPLKTGRDNFRDIDISAEMEEFNDIMEHLFDNVDENRVSKRKKLFDWAIALTNFTLNHPNVKALLESKTEKFDLVFMEYILNDAFLGIAYHFNCSIVAMSTVGPSNFINEISASRQPLAYAPNTFLPFSDKMSFTERAINAVMDIFEMSSLNYYILPSQKKIYEDNFPDPKPSFDAIRSKGVSLVLLNSHFSLDCPRPYLPNTIEVGGMHVNTKPKPLPKDIQEFIDNSPDEVVYFSMGSNVTPSKMQKDKKEAIIKVLNKIKQKVIWKWDDETLVVDKNKILVGKWFPQDDILAHPNVKLFITHGGLLSCTESIYHGVPIVGIPVFMDQQSNMAKVVSKGLGVTVEYRNISESSFLWGINEVLENENYQKKVQEVSKLFRDRPQTPLETAKYWVEYVIRNKGAYHLQSGAQDLNFWQRHNLDVTLLLLSICIFILILPILIIKIVLKLLFKKPKNKIE